MAKFFSTKTDEGDPMSNLIEKAAAGIRAIDFDHIASEMQRHREDIDAAEDAIGRANARIAEIDVELEGHKKLDVGGIADGLLGGDVLVASRRDVDNLHDEKVSLNQGAVELRRRIANSRIAIDNARNQSKISAAALFDDLADEWKREAVELATRLWQIYADSHAICSIANCQSMAHLRNELNSTTEKLGRLLSANGPLAVSEALVPLRDALEANADKGAIPLPSFVPIPRN